MSLPIGWAEGVCASTISRVRVWYHPYRRGFVCKKNTPFSAIIKTQNYIVAFHWHCSNSLYITCIYYTVSYNKFEQTSEIRKKVTSRDLGWVLEDFYCSNPCKVGRQMTGGCGSFTMFILNRIRGVFILFFRFSFACNITTQGSCYSFQQPAL